TGGQHWSVNVEQPRLPLVHQLLLVPALVPEIPNSQQRWLGIRRDEIELIEQHGAGAAGDVPHERRAGAEGRRVRLVDEVSEHFSQRGLSAVWRLAGQR